MVGCEAWLAGSLDPVYIHSLNDPLSNCHLCLVSQSRDSPFYYLQRREFPSSAKVWKSPRFTEMEKESWDLTASKQFQLSISA